MKGCPDSSRGSERLVALDRHPLNDPVSFPVVGDGIVHRRPVVPKAEVALFPPIADHEFGCRHVVVEETENGVALLLGHTLDLDGETRVDEQTASSRLGMSTDHWVLDRLQLGELLAFPLPFTDQVQELAE